MNNNNNDNNRNDNNDNNNNNKNNRNNNFLQNYKMPGWRPAGDSLPWVERTPQLWMAFFLEIVSR